MSNVKDTENNKTSKYVEQEDIMMATDYYTTRGINKAEFDDMMAYVKPYNATYKNIFNAIKGYPSVINGKEAKSFSDSAVPVLHVEVYKFLKDVFGDLMKLNKEEKKKTSNPVHVIKALIRTNKFPIIKDNLDYFTVYQGYDFDLDTAKLELGLLDKSELLEEKA